MNNCTQDCSTCDNYKPVEPVCGACGGTGKFLDNAYCNLMKVENRPRPICQPAKPEKEESLSEEGIIGLNEELEKGGWL